MRDHPALSTVARLVEAINLGDVDAAVALYTNDAVFIPQPGMSISGRAAVQEALAGMMASRPKLVTHRQEIHVSDGAVLYLADWSMVAMAPDGATPVEMSGRSTDVLRQQPDGSWLVSIDNPWGTIGLESDEAVSPAETLPSTGVPTSGHGVSAGNARSTSTMGL